MSGVITVRDLIGVALPPGTVVVAGASGLDREVTWATRIRPTPPAFGHLSRGELVLLPENLLSLLDERLTLAAAIRQLASFGVAGIAHVGAVDAAASVVADETSTPLLQLPDHTDLGPLERETARYVTERRRVVNRRGQEISRRLMELAIAGEPLATVVRGLSGLAGHPVALEGRDGRLLTYQTTTETAGGTVPALAHIEAALATSWPSVATWLRSTGTSSPIEPPSQVVPIDGQWERVVAPVIGRDGLLGSVSLIIPIAQVSPEDNVLASHGAAACAVVLAREQAAASVRREVELNVLDEVLDGALRSEVSLLQQARRLGHDLEGPHIALIARTDRTGAAANAVSRNREGRWSVLDETLVRIAGTGGPRGSRPLWRVRNNAAEILWPVGDHDDLNEVARTIRDELQAAIDTLNGPSAPETVSIGFGQRESGIAGIRRSHQEARQALTLGRRLNGPGQTTSFQDLGVYRIIYAAEGLPEIAEFHDETLHSLLAYDQQHGADLIRTLQAFFRANCSPKEAASLLTVHRNTVLYRLDRIGEITGMDLDDSDVRLRLQLALRIHTALYSDE
ncbi:MAG TPA: helix-turn-helix domain-containing protein [Thermomicrobiales bacterium]|jgi:purine catabolism regulator|nr:helix-turn-helix domain-containing protein [Thermomicrobiales bacterium]